jgi:hypothetical protein
MRKETYPVSETSCLFFFLLTIKILTMIKFHKTPAILCVIHHRQNPIESTGPKNVCPLLK